MHSSMYSFVIEILCLSLSIYENGELSISCITEKCFESNSYFDLFDQNGIG